VVAAGLPVWWVIAKVIFVFLSGTQAIFADKSASATCSILLDKQ
jgi:hypothetical protein